MSDVQLWCVGESLGLVESSSIGPLSLASAGRFSFGGAESNVAIGASRLGVRAGWVGVLGEDPFGRIIRDGIRAAGVTLADRTVGSARTGLMVKEHRLPGRARVTYYRAASAGSLLEPSDVVALPLTSSSVVHTTGITLAISHTARHTAAKLADIVEAAGARLSFDINHRSTLIDSAEAVDAYLSLVRRADIVFGGLDEYRLILGGHPTVSEVIDGVLALGPREVVVKLGSEGAAAGTGDGVWRRKAHAIEVVDSVGAGDSFVAGYLSQRIGGGQVEASLAVANTCGALTCMVSGDWEGAPTTHDLALFDDGDPVQR